jgi:hypothetical protein
MPAFADRLQRAEHILVVIDLALLEIVACMRELGDVRAGRERVVAGAAQHDAAQRVVRCKLVHRPAPAPATCSRSAR